MPCWAPTRPSSSRSTTSPPQGNWEHHTILHRNRAPALAERGRGTATGGLARQAEGGARQARVAGLGRQGAGRLERADDRGARQRRRRLPSATTGSPPPSAPGASSWTGCATNDGRLFHSWRIGKRLHRGTLDDYANMARAGIALFEATGEPHYLDEARSLVAVLDHHFADAAGGGYFITADDAADLIVRTKHCHDNAAPAGNGTLARRVRAPLGARWRRRLARQGRAPARGLRGRAGRQLLPADDAAQRLRTAAARERAGDRGRSVIGRDRGAASGDLWPKPAQQDRPAAGAADAACRRIIRRPAKAWSTANRRSTCATACRAGHRSSMPAGSAMR